VIVRSWGFKSPLRHKVTGNLPSGAAETAGTAEDNTSAGEPFETVLQANAAGDVVGTVDAMSINHVARIRQTERLVAALRPIDAAASQAGAVVAPLANLRPIMTPVGSGWQHGFSRIDGSGRVRDAVLFDSLGWAPGTTVGMEFAGDVLKVSARQDGHRLDVRGRLTLLDCHRSALGLTAGSAVLLLGDPEQGAIIVLPACYLDRLVAA
jgi:hypothetical protein